MLHREYVEYRRAAVQPNGRCQKAFVELRERLMEEPVTLADPDWEKEYYIEADESLFGVAAVLSQLDVETGKLRLIQFFSSSLSTSQKNYSSSQLGNGWCT